MLRERQTRRKAGTQSHGPLGGGSRATERTVHTRRTIPAKRNVRGVSSGGLETVRIWMLGGFRVSVGSRIVEEKKWRLKKAASLVKLLALEPGHRMHRERAMDLLWPELGPKAVANNLRQTLHAARKVLEPETSTTASHYLERQGEQLVLCPDGLLWVDVDAFEEAGEHVLEECSTKTATLVSDIDAQSSE